MAHTIWLRHTAVRGADWHPCWAQADHKAPTEFLGPSPAPSPLHPASRRTMKILVPVHTKLAAHTTRHVVVRYGLVPTAREPVLNRQCGLLQTNDYTTQVHRSIYR